MLVDDCCRPLRPLRTMIRVEVTALPFGTKGAAFAPKVGSKHDFDTYEAASEAAKDLVARGLTVSVRTVQVYPNQIATD